ncbi:MAG: tetratricopeptide repeat protein [Promethearchaeota archaeon]
MQESLAQIDDAIKSILNSFTCYMLRHKKAPQLQREVVHNQLEDYQKTIDCFKKVVEIDPQDIEVWYELGIAYNKLKNNQKAKKCVETALELDPNNPQALNLLEVLNEQEN